MTRVIDIEGIGEKYAQKLEAVGIKDTDTLLLWGATRKGREEIAEKSGIDSGLILEWLNLCDLFRIKGIGQEYSDLLEEAGVDTVAELACRNAENLHSSLAAINTEKKLVRQVPTQKQVGDWIQQAKELPRIITY